MSAVRSYVLDSDIFIQAKRNHYRFTVCPGFWDALEFFHREGRVVSIDKVKAELERGKDDLTDWVKTKVPSTFFRSTNEQRVLMAFSEIMAWSEQQERYSQGAKEKFAEGADPWLIAFAKAGDLVLVTHEVPAEFSKNSIKIPDVCLAFQVEWIDPFEMLECLGVRFSWQSRTLGGGASGRKGTGN
jgi:hypothetical protein